MYKISSKKIKDINVRPEIIQFLEENIGICLSTFFFFLVSPARETKAKTSK